MWEFEGSEELEVLGNEGGESGRVELGKVFFKVYVWGFRDRRCGRK